MKKTLYIFAILFAVNAKAQNYGDSLITLTLTQRASYWVGQYVRESFKWSERNAPTQLKNFIGSGSNPDSLFTTTFRAKYILGAMELMVSQPLQVSYIDYRYIFFNQPAVGGYSPLTTQINTKANNTNDPQRLTAQWLRSRYQERVDAYEALYNEQKNETIRWSKE